MWMFGIFASVERARIQRVDDYLYHSLGPGMSTRHVFRRRDVDVRVGQVFWYNAGLNVGHLQH